MTNVRKMQYISNRRGACRLVHQTNAFPAAPYPPAVCSSRVVAQFPLVECDEPLTFVEPADVAEQEVSEGSPLDECVRYT